jgi:hypothetical protein
LYKINHFPHFVGDHGGRPEVKQSVIFTDKLQRLTDGSAVGHSSEAVTHLTNFLPNILTLLFLIQQAVVTLYSISICFGSLVTQKYIF